MGCNCNCSVRWSTRDQAQTYCKKDNKFEEFGEWIKGQGHRTDLAVTCQRLLDGEKLKDIATENPQQYCMYRNGLRDFAQWGEQEASKKFRKVTVDVIWGDTGTGKTRQALYGNGLDRKATGYLLDAPEDGSRLWFDGYDREDTLVIDEFYGGIKYSKLLRILDGHQMRLPVKGSHTYAFWTKVIITSNKPPNEWYSFGLTPALKRRINTINGQKDFCTEVLQGNTESWSMD